MIKFPLQFLSCFVFLLSACEKNQQSTQTFIQPSCFSWQEQCQFVSNGHHFSVLFDVDKITPEMPFHLIIQGQDGQTITSINGFAEGVTMYMGKIPLIFTIDSEQKSAIAEVQFGSCSEAQMVWQLNFNIVFNAQEHKNYESQQAVKIQVNRF